MDGELKLYTVEEVAEILRVNPRFVYREIEDRQLRATRAGRLVRVSEAALREYLVKGESATYSVTSSEEDSVKCRLCGKYAEDMVRGIGTATCLSRVERRLRPDETLEGVGAISDERLDQIIGDLISEPKPNRLDEVPNAGDRPYVSVPQMHKYCVSNGVRVAWMVKALGGDRRVKEPLNEKWDPKYVQGIRYVHPSCMTEQGLNELRMAYGRGTGVNQARRDMPPRRLRSA